MLRKTLYRFALITCLFLGGAYAVNAAENAEEDKPGPSWWSTRDVLRKDAAGNAIQTDDFALINQGQLKHLAAMASLEFDAHLPGGAGDALHDLIASWNVPGNALRDDYAVVNVGQLKNVARLFYDRLAEVGYDGPPSGGWYPWGADTFLSPDDFAYANIGQAKYAFSFDVTIDTDGDGLSDLVERRHELNPNDAADALADFDGDGVSNLDEILDETDIRDYYNGKLPSIAIVSGNGQAGAALAPVSAPLEVQVMRTTSGGTTSVPLVNAPVYFEVIQGAGRVSSDSGQSFSVFQECRTDSQGKARVTFRTGPAGDVSKIRAWVQAGSYDGGVVFTCAATTAGSSGGQGSLIALNGDRQTGDLGLFLPTPLTVWLRGSDGQPVSGTQVRFRVLSGDATLAESPGATESAEIQRVTDSNGIASVACRVSHQPSNVATIVAEAEGQSVHFVVTSSAPGPLPPSSVRAERIGLKLIEVTWVDNSTNEGSFVVKRSTDDINWETLATLPPNTTAYIDNTVETGETYTYSVGSRF